MVTVKPPITSNMDINVKMKKVDVPAFLTTINSMMKATNTIMEIPCSMIESDDVRVALKISMYKINTPKTINKSPAVNDHDAPDGKFAVIIAGALPPKFVPATIMTLYKTSKITKKGMYLKKPIVLFLVVKSEN